MRRNLRSLIFGLVALMAIMTFFAACSPEEGPKDGDVKVASISITGKPSGNSINVGGNVTLGYTVSPADAKDYAVTWSSSDAAKATVDQNGKVTGISAGASVIKVAVNGTDISATLPLSVVQPIVPKPVTAIAVSGLESEEAMARGQVKSFTVTSTPADCDPYEIEWSYTNTGVAEVVETVDGYNLVAVGYGNTVITAKVTGKDVETEIAVTVAGDIDNVGGKIVETFSRGEMDAKGIYYTNADKTQTTQSPIYNGAFLNVGARVNTSTPSAIALKEGKIEWMIHNPTLNERITFSFKDIINADAGKYLVRIPVTVDSVTEENALNTKLYYGFRTKENGEEISYNHTAATGEVAMKYQLNISGQALGVFKEVGETIYLEIRIDAAKWNGDLWVGCHGGMNAGVTGKTTLSFDNIEIIDESAIEYDVDTETFEAMTVAGSTVSNDFMSVANASGDAIETKNIVKSGELGPAHSTGKVLSWTTRRVYKSGLDVGSIEPGSAHSKLILTFKNVDVTKSYTINIPMQVYNIAKQTATNTFDIKDTVYTIHSADTSDASKLLYTGSPFSAIGMNAVVTVTIPANTAWNGVLCFRLNNVNVELKNDSAKVMMSFDNIVINEVQA